MQRREYFFNLAFLSVKGRSKDMEASELDGNIRYDPIKCLSEI